MCGGLGGLCAAVEPGSRSPRPRPPGQEPLPACRGADNALAWGRVAPGQTPPPHLSHTGSRNSEESVSWNEPAASRCDLGARFPEEVPPAETD